MDSFLNQNLISSKEAGEISGYSTDYLARLARSNKIVGKRIGHAWFIDKSSLGSFVKEQNERKSNYAHELSRKREEEYRARQSTVPAAARYAPRVLTNSAYVAEFSIRPTTIRAHAAALTAAFLVVATGVAGAQAALHAGNTAAQIADEAAQGFQDAFKNNLSFSSASTLAASSDLARTDAKKILALESEAPRIALPQPHAQLASAFAALAVVPNARAPKTNVRAGTDVHASPQGAGANDAALSPRAALRSIMNLPSLARSALVAFGSAIIDGTHFAIGADVSLAYGAARIAPESARAAVAIAGGIGAALEQRAAVAPRFASITTQSLAFSSMQTAAEGIGAAYLAAANTAHFLGKTLAPGALEDTSLGLLGNTAAALDSVTGAAVLTADQMARFSPLNRAALFTYETIHGSIVSAREEIAGLFTPAARTETQVAANTATATPAFSSASTTATTAVAATASSTAPMVARASSSGIVAAAQRAAAPVYVTQGVDQNYVDQSIANLSAAVNARIADALRPVQTQVVTNETSVQQVNMIQSLNDLTVTNGTFKNGLFDGGNVTHAILVQGTTGEFTNLIGGSSSFATTTIAGTLATSDFISAPYFVATSTTATSTFAGSLTIDTTGFVYATSTKNVGIGIASALAALEIKNSTSTQPIFIANTATGAEVLRVTNAGLLGIGSSTPLYTLSVEGSSSLGNQAIGGYFTATSTTATSTFAGRFAVGTSSPFGNGLFTAGTSSPLFYIDNGSGYVGIGSTSPSANLAVSGNGYFSGNLTVGGNSVTLGNNSANTLTINSSINSSIVPNQNISYNLGSPSFYWNNAYVQNLNANNISAASTSISGTSNSTFTINSGNITSDQLNSSLIFFRGNVVPNALLTWNAATSSKRFEFNQPLYINNASGSTTEPTLTLQGIAGQTANILQIASSTGSTVFSIGPNGQLTSNSLSLSSALGLSSGGTATTTFYNGGIVFSDGTKLTQAANTNVNALTWDNANGRFGIGTTSPGTLFSVSGNSSGSQTVATFATGNGLGDENLYINTDAARGLIGLQVKTGGGTAEPLILNGSGGNVGIGTSTPQEKLTANGGILVTGSLSSSASLNGGSIPGGGLGLDVTTNLGRIWSAQDLSLNPGLAEAARFTASGNFGIGTTSPSTRLSVQQTIASPQVRVAYDNTRYADLQVDSAGNLNLNASSGNIYENNGNLFVCSNSACPSGTPVGAGVAVVQNHLGIGTSTPTDALDVVGIGPTISIRDSGQAAGKGLTIMQNSSSGVATIDNNANAALLLATNNTEALRVTSGGSVGIGTTSPTQQLSVANLLYVGAGGATGLGVATSTFQGDIKITGKLDVGTIDPVYTIDGVKYATYGQSTVGEKEEAVATLDVTDYDPASKMYVHTIKFPDLPKGSDLWLFYQITDFGQDWNNLVVSLTPAFDGTVFFQKDPANRELTVVSTAPGQVTARFIANRFDWQHWPNIRPDQNTPDQTGFQLSSKN